MANNKNPRRTIWLSETEPLSHYDIWLSKNQHLNREGDPVSDSGVQRPCDYIFKVWDCDNWYPIIGLNATAVNKIDTVLNVGYTTTHNGNTISSFSYKEFHLPLFTKEECSPSELFDGGTIGEVILEYMTEEEWGNIFNSEAFENAWETNIENIDIRPAEANKLGGIWANTFTSEYSGNNYIAPCKYKYNHGTSDYNLFVHAKDVMEVIENYIDDHSDDDITYQNMLFRLFENSASIMKGWHEMEDSATPQQIQANKPRFVIGGGIKLYEY